MSAIIYARISSDPTGMEAGVTRQVKECRELAARLGLEVAEELIDNDVSATNGKRRPQFELLMTMRPGAVIVWHQDRLLRLSRDLERVIEFDVPVHTVMSGSLDLATPAGRAVARTIAAWSQYEGEQKAERIKAASKDRRERGLPSTATFNLRPFGYERDGMTHRPAEAAAIRMAYDAVIAGREIVSIAHQWNRAGFRNANAGPWTPRSVAKVLANPRQMGKVTYLHEIVGDGVWEPMVDEITWRVARVCSRRRQSAARSLLGHIAACGNVLANGEACGGLVFITTQNGLPSYRCANHLSRRADYVDAHVTKWVLTRLARLAGDDDRRASAVVRLESLLDRERAAHTETHELEDRVVRARYRAKVGRQLLRQSAAQAWDGWDVLERRRVVDAFASITVKPAPRGRRPFDPSSVEILARR